MNWFSLLLRFLASRCLCKQTGNISNCFCLCHVVFLCFGACGHVYLKIGSLACYGKKVSVKEVRSLVMYVGFFHVYS